MDAVTPTVRICVRRLRTSIPCIHRNVHGRSVHDTTRRSSHSEKVHRVKFIFHASRTDGPGGCGHRRRRQRQVSLLPAV